MKQNQRPRHCDNLNSRVSRKFMNTYISVNYGIECSVQKSEHSLYIIKIS